MFKNVISFRSLVVSFTILGLIALAGPASAAPNKPVVFVGQVPHSVTFASVGSPFANHLATMIAAPRGGGLFIRYPDGSIKNLTEAAGYGNSGLQGANSIAVRDPSVHWDANKIIFSMVIGAPAEFEVATYHWQLYEVTGLAKGDTPVISKVSFQPSNFNNFMPFYGPNDEIYFVSDRPREGAEHLYPLLDEKESAPTNTGLWKIDPADKTAHNVTHSTSGIFEPFIDSRGKIVFSLAAYLQQDTQGEDNSYGAFNFADESDSFNFYDKNEIFPEPLNTGSKDQAFNFSYTFPWEVNLDGTAVNSLFGIGRHELLNYFESTPSTDSNVRFFRSDLVNRASLNSINNLFHVVESPTEKNVFYGTNARPYDTHTAGQIVELRPDLTNGPQGLIINYITHPDTAEYTGPASSNHSGLYRDPLKLSNNELISSHTDDTGANVELGSISFPEPAYEFRLKQLVSTGSTNIAGPTLTPGIAVNVQYYNPDQLISFSGDLWELQAVEVTPVTRPAGNYPSGLQAPEQSTFASENVDVAQFKTYLKDNNLGLVVVRDASSRDGADKQQPFNLKVSNVSQSTIAASGTVYDFAALQILQADQVRGYTNPLKQGSLSEDDLQNGRRILAVPLHSNGLDLTANNPLAAPLAGSFYVQPDGSAAALVPADRPLTWQLVNNSGQGVVRERYWFSLKAGEISACGSCHPVSTGNQVGAPEPDHEALALKKVLRWWKGEPLEVPAQFSLSSSGTKKKRKITANSFKVKKIFSKRQFKVNLTPLAGDTEFQDMELRLKIKKVSCPDPIGLFQTDRNGFKELFGKAPKSPRRRAKLTFELAHKDQVLASYNAKLIRRGLARDKQRKLRKRKILKLCKKMKVS